MILMPTCRGAIPTALLLAAALVLPAPTDAADDIDMSKIRALAALPVKDIFRDSPVQDLSPASYWKTVRASPTPVVVMFYSNVDPESQRLATLIRYVALKYHAKFSTYGVMVAESGKPAKATAAEFEKRYSLDKTPGVLDKTPGVLFYDNDRGRMELESEQYIDASFKEFRSPSMLLWRVYYDTVCRYIDKNVLD